MPGEPSESGGRPEHHEDGAGQDGGVLEARSQPGAVKSAVVPADRDRCEHRNAPASVGVTTAEDDAPDDDRGKGATDGRLENAGQILRYVRAAARRDGCRGARNTRCRGRAPPRGAGPG